MTVIELNGIRIAAMTGESVPWTANDNPITLYINEIAKLI